MMGSCMKVFILYIDHVLSGKGILFFIMSNWWELVAG